MWEVVVPKKIIKNITRYPDIQLLYTKFLNDLFEYGPYLSWYPNYGKLKNKNNIFHCHLNTGHPRYVAVWQVKRKKIKLIEVVYVGTHEKAPY